MRKFALNTNTCFNWNMKNLDIKIKNKILPGYQETNTSKSTDINVLLNRVKNNQKNESRKKLYFSAAASTGLILFGFIIFA